MIAKLFLAAGFVLTAGAVQAGELYPYHSKHNYCPTGLQPVRMGGVVCCGKPTTSVTYSSVMAHPVKKKPRRVHRAPTSAPIPLGKGLDMTGTGS